MCEDSIDEVIFCVAKLGPNTRVCDLNAPTKGDLRSIVSKEAARLMRLFPQRLAGLAHDYSTSLQVAVSLGLLANEISPQRRMLFADGGGAPRAPALGSPGSPAPDPEPGIWE